MPYCRECGGDVEAAANFCPHCGAEQWPAEDAPAPDGNRAAEDDDGTEGGVWDDLEGPIDPGPPPGTETDPAPAERRATRRSQDTARGGSAVDAPHRDAVTGEREVPTHSGGGAADAEDEVVADPSGPFPFTEGALSFALGYPTRDGYKAVILGGIFALVPILGLATNGYALQLARAAGRGRATPPEFDGVGALFVDGLKFLALSIVWYVVVLVGIVVAGIPVERGSALTGALAGGLVVGSLVYAFPAMLTALAVTDDFGAAFSPDYVLAWIATGQYLAAFLVSVVLALLLGVVVVLSFVTIVGVIFVAAWATFVLAAYWGYQYRRAVADGVVPPGGPEPVA